MKRFDPFEHVLVAVAARGRAHRGRVRARARLGQRVRARATRRSRASAGSAPSARRVPASLSPSEPSSCTARISPLVAQTFETSSIATSASSVPVPSPPYSSSKKSPKMSCSRYSSTTSHGNSCDSSISAARGAIRSRASVPHEVADLALLVGQHVPGHARSLGRRLRRPWQTASTLLPSGSSTSRRRPVAFHVVLTQDSPWRAVVASTRGRMRSCGTARRSHNRGRRTRRCAPSDRVAPSGPEGRGPCSSAE